MSFTVSDFGDLKRLLGEHPEWRVELRHLLLTDDMEALPGIVRELAEAQRRTEQEVHQLAMAQREMAEHLRRITDKVGSMDGLLLELDYARKASSYFRPWLRQARAIDGGEL